MNMAGLRYDETESRKMPVRVCAVIEPPVGDPGACAGGERLSVVSAGDRDEFNRDSRG
jgi:hypothetical protein